MASKKIKIEGSKEKATQDEGKPELVRVEVGGLRARSFQLSVGALERALLAEFPAADAEEWDRTGLLVGDPAAPVRAVAVALDPTVGAIDAAADAGANVLVTHHPAYLTPPTSFQPASSPALNSGAVVYRAIQRGVALMNFHTALDVSARAQRMLPGMLGLSLRGVVEPKAGCAEKGYGQLCAPAEKMTLGQLAARCTSVFGRAPRVWGSFDRAVGSIVTCTGSAGPTGRAALAVGADVLVAGEVKYHDALDLSQAGMAVIDLGHDTSELPFCGVLAASVRDAGVPDELVAVVSQRDRWSSPRQCACNLQTAPRAVVRLHAGRPNEKDSHEDRFRGFGRVFAYAGARCADHPRREAALGTARAQGHRRCRGEKARRRRQGGTGGEACGQGGGQARAHHRGG